MNYVDIAVADPDLDVKDNYIRSVRVRDLQLDAILGKVDPFQPHNRIACLFKKISAAEATYKLSDLYLD